MRLMNFLLGGRVKQMLLSSDQINRSRWIKTVKRLTGFCFDPAAGNNNCNSNAICGSGSVSCSASTAATVVKPNNNNCSSSAVNNHKEFYCWQQAHQVRHGVQNNFILCFAETVPCVCVYNGDHFQMVPKYLYFYLWSSADATCSRTPSQLLGRQWSNATAATATAATATAATATAAHTLDLLITSGFSLRCTHPVSLFLNTATHNSW